MAMSGLVFDVDVSKTFCTVTATTIPSEIAIVNILSTMAADAFS